MGLVNPETIFDNFDNLTVVFMSKYHRSYPPEMFSASEMRDILDV